MISIRDIKIKYNFKKIDGTVQYGIYEAPLTATTTSITSTSNKLKRKFKLKQLLIEFEMRFF